MPAPQAAAPPDELDALLNERFEEVLAVDPDEARDVAIELMGREMDRGLVSPGSLRLMLRVEQMLGRKAAMERLKAFLAAWEEPEDPKGRPQA
jgi:hypothetical protein